MSGTSGNTKFTPAICTQCGATLEVDSRQEAAVCIYCKTPFIVEKAINNYNVQHMAVNHVDSINIVKPSTIDSVLAFADKQITRRADEKKRVKEEERIENEKKEAFIKKYWWVYFAIMGVLFLMLNIIGATKGPKNNDNIIVVGVSSSEIVGKNYEDVVSILKNTGFTNIATEAIDDLIIGWLTKDGEVEKVEIGGYTSYKADSKYDANVKIVVYYHTFPEKTSETNKQGQTSVNTTKSTADDKSASGESGTTSNLSTPVSSVYDYAYIKQGKEYSNYYLIDTDKKTVKSFTSDESGFTGTYIGDLNKGIDVRYSVDEMHEQIKFAKPNDDSSIIVTDPNGFKWTFIKTSITEAEKILNQNG